MIKILEKAGINVTPSLLQKINAQFEQYKKSGFNVPIEKIAQYVADHYKPGKVTYKQVFHNLQFMKLSNIVKKDKIGRNDACTCGSGLKFKKCCIDKYV